VENIFGMSRSKIEEVLISKIEEFVSKNKVGIFSKGEGDVVTSLDLLIDRLVRELLQKKYRETYNYVSEESFEELNFPAIIIDPIDGTREFVNGIHQWALSFCVMDGPEIGKSSCAWIFNPATGFSVSSDQARLKNNYWQFPIKNRNVLTGLVSNSEYEMGLFSEVANPAIKLIPVGSIAYKLGLMASGVCDFVISLKPKNVWDIAAGTILNDRDGVNFYSQGVQVTSLNKKRYLPPLLWCKEELFQQLSKDFEQ